MHFRPFNANNAAFLGVTIAFGAVALAMYLGYFGEWRDPECDSLPVQSVASPSGARRAIHEQEACRSTDQLRTTVVVRSANASGSSSTALVFSSITGSALGPMTVGQRTLPLVLHWNGDAELMIGYPANVKPDAPSALAIGVRVVLEPAAALR